MLKRIVCSVAGDQARATAEGEIEETPLDENENAALELDDVHEVDKKPDEPGRETRDVEAENIGDGSSAADDRHVPFVEVAKRRRSRLARKSSQDDLSSVVTPLNGNLGDAGEWLAFFVERMGQIAGDENIRETGNRQIGVDLDFAAAIGFSAGAGCYTAAKIGGVHATGPENGSRIITAGSVAVLVVHSCGVNLRDESVFADFDPKTRNQLLGFRGKIFRIGAEDAWSTFQQDDASFFGTNAAEIVTQSFLGNFGECAGEFEPSGAGTHDNEREPGARFGFSGGAFGAFERVEQLVADGGGFFDGLQAGSHVAPLVVAVIRSLRAGGNQKRVVREDRAVAQDNVLGNRIEVHGFAEQDFGVFLTAEHSAKRRGNFSRGERASGHLIKERLEKMEVAFIDESDLRVGALQGLRRDKAPKASTEDDDAMFVGHVRFRGIEPAKVVPTGQTASLFR
jgi:hypothetical protein